MGHYGGIGEIAQGFCRTAAVAGATYILGRQIVSVERSESPSTKQKKYRLQLEDLPETVNCDVLVSSHDHAGALPSHATSIATVPPSTSRIECAWARCVAVLGRPLSFSMLHAPSEAPEEVPQDETKGEDAESFLSSSKKEVDTAVLVFPPSVVPTGSQSAAVHVLVTGEASVACPREKCE